MSNLKRAATPWHLWLVGGLAVLWNAGGAYDYLMTQTLNEAYLDGFSEEQISYFTSFPTWAIATWAIAVWGSLVGSLLLLARLQWAVPVFAVALACMLINFIYQAISGGFAYMGTVGAVFTAAIVAIAAFLVWYSMQVKARGVLR